MSTGVTNNVYERRKTSTTVIYARRKKCTGVKNTSTVVTKSLRASNIRSPACKNTRGQAWKIRLWATKIRQWWSPKNLRASKNCLRPSALVKNTSTGVKRIVFYGQKQRLRPSKKHLLASQKRPRSSKNVYRRQKHVCGSDINAYGCRETSTGTDHPKVQKTKQKKHNNTFLYI